jgi:hypothetical protein
MKIFIVERAILNINDIFFQDFVGLAIGIRHAKVIQPNFNLDQNPTIKVCNLKDNLVLEVFSVCILSLMHVLMVSTK